MFIDKETSGRPYKNQCKRVKGGEFNHEVPSKCSEQQTIHDVQQQIHYIHVEGPSRQCTHNSQRSMFIHANYD